MHAQIPVSPLRSKHNLSHQNDLIQNQGSIYNETDPNLSSNFYTENSIRLEKDILDQSKNIDQCTDTQSLKKEIKMAKNFGLGFNRNETNSKLKASADSQIRNLKTDFLINLKGDSNVSNNQLDIQVTPISTPVSSYTKFASNNITNGNFFCHSPQNKNLVQPSNDIKSGVQNSDFSSTKTRIERLTHMNYQNTPLPPPPKISLKDSISDDSSFEKESPTFVTRRMKDNKERLEQLTVSHSKLNISNINQDFKNTILSSNSRQSEHQTNVQNYKVPNFQYQLNETYSNNNRSNPKLPPKLPKNINLNNSFKSNISQNTQPVQGPSELVPAFENVTETKDPILNFKEINRPPTAPTFYASNNASVNNHDQDFDLSTNKSFSSKFGSSETVQRNSSTLKNKQNSTNVHNLIRPPTAPNSTLKSNSLPKVDLLINLMDKTVESKRREFEKLSKLKSALSELGNFNKRLLEENNRLKSGNSNSNLQDINSHELFINNTPTNMKNQPKLISDDSDSFTPENPYISSQINSLRTIINKKNQRISDLERRVNQCFNKNNSSSIENEIRFLLLEKLRNREEGLSKNLYEIDEICSSSILNINECVSLISEKNCEKLKVISNDILNQIEFNYKALSVTLEHLLEQQNSTLENIKCEDKMENQINNAQLHPVNLTNGNYVDLNSEPNLPDINLKNKEGSSNKNSNLDLEIDPKTQSIYTGNLFLQEKIDINSQEHEVELITKNQVELKNFVQKIYPEMPTTAEFTECVTQDIKSDEIVERGEVQRGYFGDGHEDRHLNQTSAADLTASRNENFRNYHFSINDIEQDNSAITNNGVTRGEFRITNEVNSSIDQVKDRENHGGQFYVNQTTSYYEHNGNSVDDYLIKEVSDENIGSTNKICMEPGDEYEKNAPPSVLAAYHERSYETADLLLNSMENRGKFCENNSAYYQVPANLSNI